MTSQPNVAIASISSLSDSNDKVTRQREAAVALLRHTLGDDTVAIAHDNDGAPIIVDATGHRIDGIHLSVSHSADTIAIAVSNDGGVGIDVQYPSPKLRRVESRFISANDFLPDRSDDSLLRAWTIKEAVYKAAHTPALALHDIVIISETQATTPTATFTTATTILPDGAALTTAFRNNNLRL